jgi:exodeoxyribonuclease V alpha subunit
MTAEAPNVLSGIVERVTFHNLDNGFCVIRVKARGHKELVTVVGHAAVIAAGEFVQISGTWTNDRTHGLQFRASFLQTTTPTTMEGIEKYLGSGMIRGTGPIYAANRARRNASGSPFVSVGLVARCSTRSNERVIRS